MELPGHVGVALLVYAPLAAVAFRRGRPSAAWLGFAGVAALCMAPDVDLYLAGVPHRGVTHTVWALLALAAVVGLLAAAAWPLRGRSRPRNARFGATVGGASVLSHLLGDVITPMGIRPFAPLPGGTLTLSLVYAADVRANLTLLVAGLLVAGATVAVARWRRSEPVPTAGTSVDGAGRA